MHREQSADAGQDEQGNGFQHPLHAAAHEAEHLREVADKGESPKTPLIIAGTVIAFVAPIAATVMLLAFTIAHFA
jgi:hypothetical protein